MKKLMFILCCSVPFALSAQIGIKAGLNFAGVSNASSIKNENKSGFHAGLLLGSSSKKILSSRTELIFSRQGYDYRSGSNTGHVNLDYIQLGQMMSVNITKYFSILLGFQTAYLISAQADSTKTGGESGTYGNISKLFNRIDYGYAVGAEVHPVKGLIVGARYNGSLSKVYKDVQAGQQPSFSSSDAKNNVVQIFIGWRFGKNSSEDKSN